MKFLNPCCKEFPVETCIISTISILPLVTQHHQRSPLKNSALFLRELSTLEIYDCVHLLHVPVYESKNQTSEVRLLETVV